MPLGTEVGLGPLDIVLGGGPASPPPRKGAQQPPLFDPYLLWPNGRPSQQLLRSCKLMHSVGLKTTRILTADDRSVNRIRHVST